MVELSVPFDCRPSQTRRWPKNPRFHVRRASPGDRLPWLRSLQAWPRQIRTHSLTQDADPFASSATETQVRSSLFRFSTASPREMARPQGFRAMNRTKLHARFRGLRLMPGLRRTPPSRYPLIDCPPFSAKSPSRDRLHEQSCFPYRATASESFLNPHLRRQPRKQVFPPQRLLRTRSRAHRRNESAAPLLRRPSSSRTMG